MSTREIPIFPLSTVLFPGGRLPLKLFEQRYLDMAAECMKQGTPFGVCLIREGREVGEPAVPHVVGCLAEICEWDMPQLGLLHVMARGGRRFRLLGTRAERSQLLRGTVAPLEDEPDLPLPRRYAICAEVVERILEAGELGPLFGPLRLDSASWVSYRLAELLPLAPPDKQRMLEGEDAVARLEELLHVLRAHGLRD